MDRDPVDSKAALASYVRARLREEEREAGRGYRTAVAKGSGRSQAHISNIMNRPDINVGLDVADDLARFWKMSGGSSELITVAKEWAQSQAPKEPQMSSLPNLDAALESLRLRGGPVPSDVAQELRRVGEHSRDYSMGAWMILAGEAMQAQGAPKVRAAPALPVRRSPRPAS